mmetsp:Transcript_1089/g.2996  ORF Transcript_1089/g.2996 Transcript_1089/m.2996 type:complete len:219 (+) Transcript_1089:617-1273(+)
MPRQVDSDVSSETSESTTTEASRTWQLTNGQSILSLGCDGVELLIERRVDDVMSHKDESHLECDARDEPAIHPSSSPFDRRKPDAEQSTAMKVQNKQPSHMIGDNSGKEEPGYNVNWKTETLNAVGTQEALDLQTHLTTVMALNTGSMARYPESNPQPENHQPRVSRIESFEIDNTNTRASLKRPTDNPNLLQIVSSFMANLPFSSNSEECCCRSPRK